MIRYGGFRIFILSNYSKFLFEKHTEPIPFMDRQENVDAAIKMGIQSVKVTSEEMLVKELGKVINEEI